ncbi:mandelate racemase/muconate lactonizing enzyme family protein [Siccirubricoccus phaeus]|uniref:mandelate racemase/muconate lactonizing enzyme family protein n=1 Tax=Siccirubricoccus phaeus TaxID=2595053 RepID=UPI0011F36899|nr:enolase C-terminal domain-like protein [Siccirubricoccus phaeus]
MPVITTIETILIQLPTRREHKWTGLTEPIGRYVLVKMTDDAGRVGWGEAPALKDWGGEFGRYFGESPLITRTVIERYLAPAVLGVELGDAATLHARMDAVIKGYPYAKGAVDFAFYDLTGRWLGVPVHLLLGGRSRTRIPVTHSIGLIPIPQAVEEVAQVAAEGIRTIKIKVGVDPKRDVEMVRQIRAAVGPEVDLCVDANEGYRTPGEAIRTIRQMEEQRLIYAEQPVMGIERLAEVARAIDTPVMADESAWNAHDVVQIIEHRAAQIVSIYTTKPGGLLRAMEVAAVCRAAGIICNVNGSVETGIGNLANIQLAAAAPAVTLSCVVPVSTPAAQQRGQVGGIYYRDDLIAAPMTLEDGAILVPTGPGMGIEADLKKIETYRVSE